MSTQMKPVAMYRNAGWSLVLKPYQDAKATVPFPLTGYTGRAQMRAEESQSSTLLADMTVSIDTVENTITLSIAQSVLKDITAAKGYFDVLLIPSGADPYRIAPTEVSIYDGETVCPTP